MFSTLKILVISQHWIPEVGVPQRRWAWLAEMLIQRGHEVSIIAPVSKQSIIPEQPDKSGDSCIEGAFEAVSSQISVFPSLRLNEGSSLSKRAINQGLVALGMVFKSIQMRFSNSSYRPDLIIGSVPALPIALITPIVSFIFGSSYVIDLRDAWPELLKETRRWNLATGRQSFREKVLLSGPIQILSWVVTKLMHRALGNADGIIVTSKYLETDLKQRFSGKLAPPKLVTIRNVFPSLMSRGENRKPQHGNLELNVIYAGTLGRAQNLSNAVEAVAIAKKLGVTVNLKLVGSGAAKQFLMSKAESEPTTVEVIGRVNSAVLESLYSWADSGLVHLTDWEALNRAIPSKTYELMHLGIHISGVVSGETANLISELEAGYVVKPENPDDLAMLWADLAKNRDKLNVSDKGRNWVRDQRVRSVPTELEDFLGRLSPKNER